MIKAVGIVMSRDRKLMGMVFSGKPKELGRISNESEVKEMVDMQKAHILLRVCKNFTSTDGIITPRGNEKLNELTMYVETANGVVPVNNGITLSKKITEEGSGDIKGFEVVFNGTNEVARYYYKDVVTLATFYRPRNFVVRVKGNTHYIAGKQNVMSLDELPTEVIPSNSKKKKKAPASKVVPEAEKKTATEPVAKAAPKKAEKHSTQAATTESADIFTIIDKVKQLGGLLVYLPSEKYEATLTTDKVADERFSPIGGLVAYPKLEHSNDAMKVNVNFRKPGTLNLDGVQVLTYMHAYRTLIKNGYSNVKKLGIGVPQANEQELIQFIGSGGAAIKFSKLSEGHLVQAIKTMMQLKDYVFYVFDLDGVKTMSNERIKHSEVPSDKIEDIVMNIEKAKVLRKIAKEFVKALPEKAQAVHSPHPAYSMYRDDLLDKLRAAGVDVATGSFNVRINSGKTSEGSDDRESPISVVYYLKGMTNIPKVTELLDPNKKSAARDLFAADIAKMPAIQNNRDQLEALIDKCDKAIDAYTEKLWMHKAAMLQKTNWKKVHSHDVANWAPVPARANTTGEYYSYVGSDKLILKLEGDVSLGKADK